MNNRVHLLPDGQIRFVPPAVLAPEDCVRYGGHCWYEAQRFLRGDGVTLVDEKCKHCPATRSGQSRDSFEWTYPEGQP